MDGSSPNNILPTSYKPKSNPTMKYIKIGAIVIGALLILFLLVISIWSYSQYADLKNNFDKKLTANTEAATKKIDAEYEQKYQERIKSPYLTFTGPTDYGTVSFQYPNTWNLYVGKDITAANYNGDYEAYFNPNAVPAVSNSQKFALRLTIAAQSYDSVKAEYDSRVKSRDLKSTAITVNGVEGTRLEGKISKDVTGVIVLIKIRDKTLIMQTDSKDFVSDFDKILTSTTFVK